MMSVNLSPCSCSLELSSVMSLRISCKFRWYMIQVIIGNKVVININVTYVEALS